MGLDGCDVLRRGVDSVCQFVCEFVCLSVSIVISVFERASMGGCFFGKLAPTRFQRLGLGEFLCHLGLSWHHVSHMRFCAFMLDLHFFAVGP